MTRRVLLAMMADRAFTSGQPAARAKEKQLKDALFALRTAIDAYTFDHQRAPRSLDDLVRGHYLRQIPADPITGSRSTWHTLMEDSTNAIHGEAPGIFDIRSASNKTASDGKRYSQW